MYTYIEQMWRLSASERAELKVKHGHTSRFARHTDERAVCYSEAILVYGGVKVNIAQQHSISSGEPSRVACPTRWRRLLPANEFPWNSRARIPRCHAGDSSRGEKGSLEFPAR